MSGAVWDPRRRGVRPQGGDISPTLYPPRTARHRITADRAFSLESNSSGEQQAPATGPRARPGPPFLALCPSRRRKRKNFQTTSSNPNQRVGEGGMEDLGLWFGGQEQRKETSRPHPFKGPREQRLPGPRGVGLAQPPPPAPPAPRPEPAEPAHPRPARAHQARARAPPSRPHPGAAYPAGGGRPRRGSRGAEGLGSRVAEDAECLASPTSSLFRSNGPGRSFEKRADTVTRDRET